MLVKHNVDDHIYSQQKAIKQNLRHLNNQTRPSEDETSLTNMVNTPRITHKLSHSTRFTTPTLPHTRHL